VSLTLFAALGLSACGTGFDTAVNQQYQAAVGADHREGDVEILHATVVADEGELQEGEQVEVSEAEGQADEAEGPETAPATTGTVAASIVNKSDDDVTLTGITAGAVDGETVEITSRARVEVPQGNLVRLGISAETLFAASPIQAGRYVELTFRFSDGSTVVLNTPIVSRGQQGVYDTVVESTEGRAQSQDRTGNADEAEGEETTARPE
jgi:copper(I)-binding protein